MGVFGNRKTKPLPGTPSSTEGGPGIIDQHIQVGYNPGFYRSSPQWYPGENINTRNPTQNLIVVPETITDGINKTLISKRAFTTRLNLNPTLAVRSIIPMIYTSYH